MRRNRMRMKLNTWLGMATLVGLLAGASGAAVARGWQPAQGSQSQPPAQQTDKPKTPDVTPLSLDAPAPVNAEEDAAYKPLQGVIPNAATKKTKLSEPTLEDSPTSHHKARG